MPMNTLSVATAVTPAILETYVSHYLNRTPLRHKPTAHISYHEGLRLIRQFLEYSSRHSVEELQSFTGQWVPAPTWVRIYDNEIAPQFLDRAAEIIRRQLGRKGIEKVGGSTWWTWRRPGEELKAEWIEMKKDFNTRQKSGARCDRCILYVHGGAYYFGSVDEHRYQMQRHARKLKARVLAPRYRLAPQFPFPCGLMDCIATYFYLLQHFPPDQILFAGDSAGGGMVLAMLVTLRDQGCPLPAGTILLSPWVDLTHSFPSVAGTGAGDYIPPHGFHHKPSLNWPPMPEDEVKKTKKANALPPSDAVELPATTCLDMRKPRKPGHDGQGESDEGETDVQKAPFPFSQLPGFGDQLSIVIDGKRVEIKDQIQLYTTNEMLSHPLVSPVLQPSLGGLPPMLIQVGGAELLKDEQIYLAHKAANPTAFPPGDAILDEYDPDKYVLNHYPPTNVQLQVWEDLCHVPHTLSFTRPAKYMYRSVAQFGAWALAHAGQKGVDLQNDDAVSFISSGEEDDDTSINVTNEKMRRPRTNGSSQDRPESSIGAVGKAGDALPPFKDHMIRQRVTRHGIIYPLTPQSEIAALALDPATIGSIKPGPVKKWLAKRKEMETRFGNEKRKVQKKRAKELAQGYDDIPGECPPPTALVGRRRKGVVPEEKRKKRKSWGLAIWSGWGSSHDESTLEKEERLEEAGQRQQMDLSYTNVPEGTAGEASPNAAPCRPINAPVQSSMSTAAGTLYIPGIAEGDDGKIGKTRRTSSASYISTFWKHRDRSDSRPRTPYDQITDTGQASTNPQLAIGNVHTPYSRRSSASTSLLGISRPVSVAAPTTLAISPESIPVPGTQNTFLDPNSNRPHNGIVAYPFKLMHPNASDNASIATLDSQAPSAVDFAGGPVELPTPADEIAGSPIRRDDQEPVSALPQMDVEVLNNRDNALAQLTSESPAAENDDLVSPMVVMESKSRPVSTFTTRNQPFDNRISMLGAIGADGMPIAPMNFYESKKATKEEPTGVTDEKFGTESAGAANETRRDGDFPVDALESQEPSSSQDAPFKINLANSTPASPSRVNSKLLPSEPPSSELTQRETSLGPEVSQIDPH